MKSYQFKQEEHTDIYTSDGEIVISQISSIDGHNNIVRICSKNRAIDILKALKELSNEYDFCDEEEQ